MLTWQGRIYHFCHILNVTLEILLYNNTMHEDKMKISVLCNGSQDNPQMQYSEKNPHWLSRRKCSATHANNARVMESQWL